MARQHDGKWVPSILLASVCAGGLLALLSGGNARAQFHPPTTVMAPLNDGGVAYAPPRQFAAVQTQCAVDQKTLTIQNPNDTDQNPGLCNVRVGSSRTKAFPVAKKNGIVLAPGQSISWDVYANGSPYAVSECTNDAGVALGEICGTGGLP